MASLKKELNKEAVEASRSILKAATTAAQTAAGVTIDTADQKIKGLFEQLKTEHQTVTLKIKRKDLKRESYGLFVVMEGLPVEEVNSMGVDVICQDQGGDGIYMVDVVAGGKNWGQVGPLHVSGGIRYDKPRLIREDPSAMTGSNVFQNPVMGTLMGGPQKTGDGAFAVRDLAAYMGKQSESSQASMQQSSDRMMQMMIAQQAQQQQMYQQQQAQQQQNQQSQMQMMMAMLGVGKQNESESSELRMLKDEIKQLRDEQKRTSELSELKMELERVRTDKKDSESSTLTTMMPMIMNAMNSNDGQSAAMAQIFSASQQSQQEANNRFMVLMKEMMDKPGEDEKARGFMDTVMTMMGNQVSIVGQMMSSGILGGGESPTVTMLKQGIDSVTEIAVAAMNRGGGEEGGEEETAVIQQAPQLPTAPQAPELLPEHAQAAPMGDLEEEQGEEFDFSTDPGLSKIINLIENQGHVKEISARLWAHSKSGHIVSNRWMNEPENYGIAIMHQLGIPQQRFLEITQDIIEFTKFLGEGGNPNAWSADTGYIPVKNKRKMSFDPDAPQPIIEHLDGREEQVIEETEVYSPLKAPEGVEPTDAEFIPNPSITPPAPKASTAQSEISEKQPVQNNQA